MNAHVQPGPVIVPPPHPEGATLAAVAAASVARQPTQAIIRSGATALSYADLWSRAQQMAGGLAASGITAGQSVGVALPQGAERLTAELAATLLDASIASLDWPADDAEAVAALVPLAPALIIIPQGSTLARLDIPLLDLPTLARRDDHLPRLAPAADDPAGKNPEALALVRPIRTGRGQPLRLSHAALLGQLRHAAAITPRDAENTLTTATPQDLVHGCDPGWLALIAGATWQPGAAPEAALPRPVLWRSLLQRIARG